MKNLTFHENYIFYSSIQPNPYIPYFAMTQKVVCYWVELEPQKFNSEKQAKVLTLFPKSHSFSPVSSPFRPSKYLSWGTTLAYEIVVQGWNKRTGWKNLLIEKFYFSTDFEVTPHFGIVRSKILMCFSISGSHYFLKFGKNRSWSFEASVPNISEF